MGGASGSLGSNSGGTSVDAGAISGSGDVAGCTCDLARARTMPSLSWMLLLSALGLRRRARRSRA
jgi:hypothetical protein